MGFLFLRIDCDPLPAGCADNVSCVTARDEFVASRRRKLKARLSLPPGLAIWFLLFGFPLLVGCSSPERGKEAEAGRSASCAEPENPYSPGTGHYAGYEWAEEHGGDCNGNSNSFNEGCEEYEQQEADYEECERGSR